MLSFIQDYYQDDFDRAIDGIDFSLLKEASFRHREFIQQIWEGGSARSTPALFQPSKKNYTIQAENGTKHLVYYDSLSDQLASVQDSIAKGYLAIPMVLCDFNTLPVSALFNPEIVAGQGKTDAFTRPLFSERAHLERLEKPTLDHPMISIMLQSTERLRKSLPDYIDVGVRLNTGPISVGAELRGATDLILDMKETPDLYRHYMKIITDCYIDVRNAVQSAAGIKIVPGKIRPDVSIHAPTTGVMICDDTIQLLGPEEFEECAAPHLERVFASFGGGTIHSCGDTTHLFRSIAQLDGLHAFEFGQGELIDWAAAREALNELVLIFWPPAGDPASLETAFDVLHQPKTFMYSGIEFAEEWNRRW